MIWSILLLDFKSYSRIKELLFNKIKENMNWKVFACVKIWSP